MVRIQKCFSYNYVFERRCARHFGPPTDFPSGGRKHQAFPQRVLDPLEQQRSHKWLQTVANSGLLPIGWFSKVKVLRPIMPQLTYAQGTHVLFAGC